MCLHVSLGREVFPKEYKKALLAMKEKKEVKEEAPAPARRSGTDLEDVAGRPVSVQNPEKKKGFHEYERKALPYRDHKDRVLDWEEVYASQTRKSAGAQRC